MRNYKCIETLTRQLSDAADEVISCANAYYSEGGDAPFRALISDLIDEHGFDEQYAPLLINMLNERSNTLVFEDIVDEITAYRDQPEEQITGSPLPFAPERMGDILDKALNWIGGNHQSDGALYNTLVEQLCMSDEEIAAAGFSYLKEYFYNPDEDESPGMKLE